MAAPGVNVSTAVRSGPSGVVLNPSGQYFVVGLAERGPTNVPTKINSMADYRRVFGDRVTYGALYDDLQMFFEAGGTQAWVLRVVGAAATVGTVSIDDASSVDTLRVDAASPGSWSSRLSVQIELGSAGANSRKITVRLDGAIVETYNNLTSIGDFVSRFAASPYIRVTDLGSVTAAPGNLPAVAPAANLAVGNDDRAAVNAARIAAVLPLLKIGYGDGSVAAPGYGASVHAALVAHAKDYRRIAILEGARGGSAGDYATLAAALATTPGSENAGLFGPYLQVSDGAGGVRTIPPAGFVAAARAKAHDQFGAWAVGAGEGSVSPYILGVESEWGRTEAEQLSAARVNPIRVVQNKIRLYDWRSLSANEQDYASLAVADLLDRLVTECEARLETFVFRTIDGRGQLFAEVKGVLIGILEPVRAAGGIFERTVNGEVLDSGYSVNVSQSLNTEASLARNEINAQVAVRPSPNASLINLTIVKVGLAAAA